VSATKPRFEDYPFQIPPLSAEDGGRYLITFPGLPGCMSDGETPEEAVENGRDAFECWMEVHQDIGLPVPVPGGSACTPSPRVLFYVNES
jgi:antitoxin HicB